MSLILALKAAASHSNSHSATVIGPFESGSLLRFYSIEFRTADTSALGRGLEDDHIIPSFPATFSRSRPSEAMHLEAQVCRILIYAPELTGVTRGAAGDLSARRSRLEPRLSHCPMYLRPAARLAPAHLPELTPRPRAPADPADVKSLRSRRCRPNPSRPPRRFSDSAAGI
jgi:hypothetical protein